MPDRISEWSDQIEKDASASAFEFLTHWIQRGWEWASTGDKWDAAAKKYLERWTDRWGSIKPLGADHPISLERIFVQARAVPRSLLRQFVSIEAMEEALRKSRDGSTQTGTDVEHEFPWSYSSLNRTSEKNTAQSGILIANSHSRLNLLGAPGSGKSTFVRRLGLEALYARSGGNRTSDASASGPKYAHKLIPVLIELRSLRNRPCSRADDLTSLIVDEFANAGFPRSVGFIESALNSGSLLILFDGVDEIPSENVSTSIRAITEFISRYSECRYVTTCRTAFYHDWFSGFHDFVLAEFDKSQIEAFARQWFVRPEELEAGSGAMFLRLLYSRRHRSTRDLAGSPLLLTFLCLVFRRTQQFPFNRAQLYHEALRIYLTEWNATKFVHSDPVYKDLSPETELEMLKEIAGPAFFSGRYLFTSEELKASIARFLENELSAPKSLSGRQILDAIAIQQGIFVERANDIWAFSHLTIQEYLAAAWIVDEERVNEVITAHAHDDRWREIFLLLAGLTRTDHLLKGLTARAEEEALSFTVLLCHLEATAQSDLPKLQKHDSARELSTASAEEVCLLLRTAYLAAVNNDKELFKSIFRALNFENRELIQTSEGGIYSIAKLLPSFSIEFDLEPHAKVFAGIKGVDPSGMKPYTNLCALICECKQAALRLSRDVWADVSNRLLTAPRQFSSLSQVAPEGA